MRPVFSILVIVTGTVYAAELSVSIGAGPGSSSVKTGTALFEGKTSTAAVLVDGSVKLIGLGPISISGDLPLAIGGPAKADAWGASTGAGAYAERLGFALTPGLKGRFSLGALSPWVSFGAGAARLQQAGAFYPTGLPTSSGPVQSGSKFVLALSPAGGVDWHPVPLFFIRGELRSYVYKTPDQFLVGIDPFRGNWRQNLLFLGGIGIRF